MKISDERKQSIIMYLLERIAEKRTQVSQCVAEACAINQSTVHSYLNELSEAGIIRRVKRGEYTLVKKRHMFRLSRSKNEIVSEEKIFNDCLKNCIKDFSDNIRQIWEYAFSEMVNNVIDHSSAECLDIVIEQNYLQTTVYISDNGIGIFEKICKHFGLSSADDAICELFKGKLTTDSDNHSGEGIFFTSRMMDKFYIVSDKKFFTTNKFNEETVFDFPAFEKGTIVCMSLSNFTNRTSREIFDSYADVDGGFVKTKIVLKNIFDSDPVSRSQAKRVCNRLENFEEVLFDFDGIEWIGQGFAHQLFVVFAKKNPDVKLLVENMNSDVKKMYNHVTLGAVEN